MSSVYDFGGDHIEAYEDCWANCPDDILLMIFQYLDIKSLINCMLVNKVWRDIVDYQCQHCRLWQKMVESGITNKGITFKEKSLLGWRDILYNSLHWYNVKNATIGLHQIHKIENIRSIKVYKDNLIVVCSDTVKYFNTNNLKLRKTVDSKCLTHEESDFLTVTVTLSKPKITGYNSVSLKNKLHLDNCICENKVITKFDIGTYKLQANRCYYLDIRNVIWLYVAKHCEWDGMVLAKYYGNRDCVRSLHVYENRVYLILKRGDVLRVDKESRMFEHICDIDVPFYFYEVNSFLFHTYSVILRVKSDKCFQLFPQKKNNQIVLAIPGVTSATEHGDVLLLGFEDGKIQIYIIRKILQSDIEPEIELHLRNFTDITETNLNITAIEVYEDYGKHHLLVATDSDVIYQIVIT